MNKPLVAFVLALHIILLILIWGGINALGCAVLLAAPAIVVLCWISFEKGKSTRSNIRHNINNNSLEINTFRPFRG